VARCRRAHFADHCASCHGNDGQGHTELGRKTCILKRLTCACRDTQRLTDGELYWIIREWRASDGDAGLGNGTSDDADTWKLVHFVRHLKDLTAEHLEEMEALNPKTPSELEEERQDRSFSKAKARRATSDPFTSSSTQGAAMNRLITLIVSVSSPERSPSRTVTNVHVRGVVTQVSAQSITVQTADKRPKRSP